MVRLIIKQLWNNRRSNGWLMTELVLITFFLWIVIDPTFVLFANRSIPKGYDTDNTFLLSLGAYPSTHPKYKQEEAGDSLMNLYYFRLLDEVRHYPGVESVAVTSNYPFAQYRNGMPVKRDTVSIPVDMMSIYRHEDYFRVFRIPDIYSGGWEHLREKINAPNHIVITEGVQTLLFPGENAVGKVVTNFHGEELTIAAVVADFKSRSMEQPHPLVFIPYEKIRFNRFPNNARIILRIRDNLSATRFAEEFLQDMKSRFSIGNYYFVGLEDFDILRKKNEYTSGATNTIRRQTGMTVFFLLSIFLGVTGTFWIRSNSRRGEIGLMIALGSTHRQIRRNFLLESWLLTSMAWIIGIFFTLQRVYLLGFAYDDKAVHPDSINAGLLQNQPVVHFLIVSAIVYLLMIAITLVATWIPAQKAASIPPAEALRDE